MSSFSAQVQELAREQRAYKQQQTQAASSMPSYSKSVSFSIVAVNSDGTGNYTDVWLVGNSATMIAELYLNNVSISRLATIFVRKTYNASTKRCGFRVWNYGDAITINATVVANQEVSIVL